MTKAWLVLSVFALGCAAGSGDDGVSAPDVKPVVGAGEQEPPDDPGTGGAEGNEPGAGGSAAGGAAGSGDNGDEPPASGGAAGAGSGGAPGGGAPGGGGSGAGGSGGGAPSGGGASGGGGASASGQCGGKCGSTEPQGAGCYCDVLCIANLDCCPDFFAYCL